MNNWSCVARIDLKPSQKDAQSLDLYNCKVSSRLDPRKGIKSRNPVGTFWLHLGDILVTIWSQNSRNMNWAIIVSFKLLLFSF